MGKIYLQCMTESKQLRTMKGRGIQSNSGGFEEEGPIEMFYLLKFYIEQCLDTQFWHLGDQKSSSLYIPSIVASNNAIRQHKKVPLNSVVYTRHIFIAVDLQVNGNWFQTARLLHRAYSVVQAEGLWPPGWCSSPGGGQKLPEATFHWPKQAMCPRRKSKGWGSTIFLWRWAGKGEEFILNNSLIFHTFHLRLHSFDHVSSQPLFFQTEELKSLSSLLIKKSLSSCFAFPSHLPILLEMTQFVGLIDCMYILNCWALE